MPGDFLGFGVRIASKSGGIHTPDPNGGIFQTATDKFLIKRDLKSPANDIAEFLASRIFSAIAPGSGAEIFLTQNLSEPVTSNPYLASRYFKNYKDLYEEMGYKKRSSIKEALQPLSLNKKSSFFKLETILAKKNDLNEYLYNGYELIIAISLLIANFSQHSGNLGLVGNSEKKKLVSLDFGAAFRNLTPDVYPFQSIKNRVGREKNYLRTEHPEERLFSVTLSKTLNQIAQFNLNTTILDAWSAIEINFESEAILSFRAQIKAPDKRATWKHLQLILAERQASLITFSKKIDDYLKADNPTKWSIKKALYQEAPELITDTDSIKRYSSQQFDDTFFNRKNSADSPLIMTSTSAYSSNN